MRPPHGEITHITTTKHGSGGREPLLRLSPGHLLLSRLPILHPLPKIPAATISPTFSSMSKNGPFPRSSSIHLWFGILLFLPSSLFHWPNSLFTNSWQWKFWCPIKAVMRKGNAKFQLPIHPGMGNSKRTELLLLFAFHRCCLLPPRSVPIPLPPCPIFTTFLFNVYMLCVSACENIIELHLLCWEKGRERTNQLRRRRRHTGEEEGRR